MADVSVQYGPARGAEPLTETEQGRLRVLAAKSRPTPTEQYELGALKGRARSTQHGRRLLEDISHELAVRGQRPVTRQQANSAIAKAVRDAIDKRLAEED